MTSPSTTGYVLRMRFPFVALLAIASACATAAEPVTMPILEGAYVAGCPSSPNCVSTAAPKDDAEHYAAPLRYEGDIASAKTRMKAIIDAMPRTALVEETDTALRYTFTTRLMRYVDDVELVFTPDGTIAYRSASRVGHGDMGVNRKRMAAVAQAWAAR